MQSMFAALILMGIGLTAIAVAAFFGYGLLVAFTG